MGPTYNRRPQVTAVPGTGTLGQGCTPLRRGVVMGLHPGPQFREPGRQAALAGPP